MDGVYSRPRPKRPYFEPQREDIGHMHKRVRHPQPPSTGPDETVFRILCPESKARGVIGKGGSIFSQIRQETGARVTVQETVQGCKERVIVISVPEDARNNGGDLGKVSRAQEALFRVHGRIFEDIVDENNSNNLITTRLVVPNGQVGCLLGKGGKIIQQMREETKAHIRIFPREMTLPCVLTTNEILQIIGREYQSLKGNSRWLLLVYKKNAQSQLPKTITRTVQVIRPYLKTYFSNTG